MFEGMDPDVPVVVATSLGLLVLAIVACGALFGVFAAVRHKRWGVASGVVFMVAAAALLLALTWSLADRGMRAESEVNAAFVSTVEAGWAKVPTNLAIAEVASDDELLDMAAAAPKIQLDDKQQPTEPAAEVESFIDLDDLPSPVSQPDWIEAKAKLHDKVFAAGPFLMLSQCDQDIRKQMLAWLCEKAGVDIPAKVSPALAKLLDDTMRQTHLSRRNSPEGIVYFKYTRAHSDETVLKKVREEVVDSGVKTERPAWLDAEPEPNQTVITIGPYSWNGNRDQRVGTEVMEWVEEQTGLPIFELQGTLPHPWWPEALEELEQRMVLDTYRETRETSVGTVFLLHKLVQFDADNREWVAQRSAEWQSRIRRERGVPRVALGGVVLLAGLAVLYGFLRSGKPDREAAASWEA